MTVGCATRPKAWFGEKVRFGGFIKTSAFLFGSLTLGCCVRAGETLANAAADAGDGRFATLIAQAPGIDPQVRDLLRLQVNVWNEQKVPIDGDRVPLFELMSGQTRKHQREQTKWLVAFALQVWYGNAAMDPLKDVLKVHDLFPFFI